MLVVGPDLMLAVKKAIPFKPHPTDALLPEIGDVKLTDGCTLSESDMNVLKRYIFIENFHVKNRYHSVLFQGSALTEKGLRSRIEEFDGQRRLFRHHC